MLKKKVIKCFFKCLKNKTQVIENRYVFTENNLSDIEKVLNILKYTTIDKKAYSAEKYSAGYHTVKLGETTYKGQRDIAIRFENIQYDFTNKNVLDIGCNQGGMLMHIYDDIKNGYGIDYNYKLINGANRLKDYKKYTKLHFYVFDLEKENLNIINDFYTEQLDIIFLLSICMWIKNWKDVIAFASNNAKDMLFESNGTEVQQADQINFLKQKYKNIKIIDESSRDDEQKYRKLILCQN